MSIFIFVCQCLHLSVLYVLSVHQPPDLVGPCLRHKVPESNGRQCHKAEVGRVQESPVFPFGEEEGAADYVANHQHGADPQGYLK